MKIRELFAKPIDRPIEGVIKADDDAHLVSEIEEYIVTNEVAKHLGAFFEAYNAGNTACGAWISGFFGSGKSHLLKMLSLVLENRVINGTPVGEVFADKIDDEILKGNVRKAFRIPSKSILFNIDQKSDIISKQEFDALLAVFLKVFNAMQGYYPKQPYIAQFERDLAKSGKLEAFREAFAHEAGEPWEEGRETAHGLDAEPFAKAYSRVTGNSVDEGYRILDRYYDTYKVSIEDFADMVKAFLDTQGPDFRLNFFVDEVGQYIADNSKLMVNLQTIAESLSTRCKGRAWILVTSQEDMSTVVGEMARIHTTSDFSKIQDRFKTRLPLTSKDVSEVIQRRLLAKRDAPEVTDGLAAMYERERSNFRTLFEFVDGSRGYHTFRSEESFCASYPFVPYQYDLFQAAINGLSRNNAFTGKHASVGERSMLGVFQEVAKKIADQPFGHLATFDLMFEGIRSVIKSEHQQAILIAERNLGNPLSVRILKALFLVKYLKEYKGTPRNIAILMIDAFDIDLQAHAKAVQEALNLLEQNTYVQRTGEIYEFLTDDEKDVENEIKSTEIDETAISELAATVAFDEIIRDTKIRHEDNQQDYLFSRKFDGMLKGREHELCIHIISPFHELHGDETMLINHAMGRPELLLLLPADQRLLSDLNLYAKTDKYIRQNHNSALADSRRRILAEKGQQNITRKGDIRTRLQQLLAESKAIVNGSEVTGLGSEPRGRVISAFHHLLRFAYPNLKMLRTVFREDSAGRILADQGDDLFRHDDGTLSEGEQELLTHVRRKQQNGERPTIASILQEFSRRPYGWYQAAVLANIAKLFMRGKVELRSDSNILEKDAVLNHLSNNRYFTNTIVFLQEEFDSAAIQRLKQFHQEFFDASNPATEAKEVALHFQEKLKTEVATLQELASRTASFPFVSKLGGPIAMLCEWADKQYTVFLKDIATVADDWLDAKEDSIDPIRKFVHGQQGQVYLQLHTFYRDNRANLSDIDADAAAQLQAFLESPTPYRGSALQEAKGLMDALAQRMEQVLQEEREQAVARITAMANNIQTLDGFADLSAPERERLFRESTRALDEIRNASLIAVVRDKLNRYAENGYQKELSVLNEINAAKAKASGVEEEAAHFVTKSSIRIAFNKGVIESEEDLEAYLGAVRKAYLNELNKRRKITI